MALNLEGYSTPEKSYEQLYGLGEQLQQNAYRKEQMQQREEARKAAVGTFLNNYLDQKDYLTGTQYDPEIVRRLNEMLMQGADLATKGANASEIMLALGPKVGQLGEYSSKAKLIKAQKDKTLEHLKPYKGINQDKFSQAFDDAAFFETDPTTGDRKMKDISQIDPNKLYGDEVLQNADVFTNQGVGDFVKNSGKETRKGTYKYYNKLGSLTQSSGEYVAPPWMQAEMDERGAFKEFVPNHDIPTNEGIPQELDFHEKEGKVTAPIRMVTDDVWNTLSPDTVGYFRQEARKYAKEHGVDLNSTQAYNFAKAIAYDELKASGRLSSTVNETPEYTRPSNQEIRLTFTGSPYAQRSGGSSGNETGAQANEFDRIDLSKYGNPPQGRIDAFPASDMPSQIIAILKGAGHDVSKAKTFQLEIDKGNVVAITPVNGKRIDFIDMQNAQEDWERRYRKGEEVRQKFGDVEGRPGRVEQPSNAPKAKFKDSYQTPKGAKSLTELRKYYSDEQIQDYINKGVLK